MRLLSAERILSLSSAADDPIYSPVREEASAVALRTPAEAEALASLHPDLVLTSGWMPEEKIQAMRALGIPVEVLPIPASGEAIILQYEEWGAQLGVPGRAAVLAEAMRAIRDEKPLSREWSGSRSILDLPVGGVTGGVGSLWNDMCRQAGLKNAAETLPTDSWGMASLGSERILSLEPDYLHSSFTSMEELEADPVYSLLAAVKNKRVVRLPAALQSSPGYGFWLGVQVLREAIRTLP